MAAPGTYSAPTLSIYSSAGSYADPDNSASMTLTPGNFNSVSQTIAVSTTNYSGYTLSFYADDSSAALSSNIGGTVHTIPTVSSATTSSAMSNAYGYNVRLGNTYKVGGADSYSSVPISSTALDTTTSANASVNSYTLTFGAKVDETKAAGTYTKTYTVTASANPAVHYSMTYNKNTEDTVTGMPSNIADTTVDATTLNFTPGAGTPTRTGYDFLGWATSSSATTAECTNSPATSCTFSSLDPDMLNALTLYAVWQAKTYTITLTNTNATTAGSTSATATYGSSSLSSITNPSRSYTISGFTTPSGNNASGATVSSTATKTHTYSFAGWYTASSGGYQVITSAKALVASAPNNTATLTNASSQWISTSGTTLYAHWSNGSVTLPTISKTGYTCGWTTTSTGATTITYESGYTGLHPTGNMTLYGVCVANKYNLVVTGDSNLSSLTLKQGSTSGTTVNGSKSGNVVTFSNLTYGISYYLYPVFASGYEFDSWSKTDSATNAALGSTSTENTYYTMGAGAGALTLASKSSITTFDSAFAAADKTKSNGYYKIQDATNSICSAVTTGQSGTLIDTRDNQTYTVAKLKGGKCWMAENLRLGATTITTNLTSSNTNINTTITASTFNSWKKSSGTATYTSPELISVSGTDSTSGTPYGVLYNYCVASGKTICTSSNSKNASYDLCPAGWRLPTGGSGGEFEALYNQYNSYALMRAPIADGGAAFALAGSFYNNTPNYLGRNGNYQASTVNLDDSSRMYRLELQELYGTVDPTASNTRSYGRSIRCVVE